MASKCARVSLMISAAVAAVGITHPVMAAPPLYSWSGADSTTDWTSPTNWVGGTAPNFTGAATNPPTTGPDPDLQFFASPGTSILTMEAANNDDVAHQMIFEPGAPAYTFQGSNNNLGLPAFHSVSGQTNGPSGGFSVQPGLYNFSSNAVTDNTTGGMDFLTSGQIVAETAGLIINDTTQTITNPADPNKEFDRLYFGSNTLTYIGYADSQINVGIDNTNRAAESTGGVLQTSWDDLIPVAGGPIVPGGAIVLNHAAATHGSPMGARVIIGLTNTPVMASSESVRVGDNNALGDPGNGIGIGTASFTQVNGNMTANGELQLYNNVTVPEYVLLEGRASGDVPTVGFNNALNPAIISYSGNNTLSGTIDASSTNTDGSSIGQFFNFGANAGATLTVTQGMVMDQGTDGYVQFFGAGNGNFGSLTTGTNATTSVTATSVSVVQRGTGVMTLTDGANLNLGHIMSIGGGKIALGTNFNQSSAFASTMGNGQTPRYHVQGGSSLDASAMPGGLLLNRTLSGSGSVQGGVTTTAGATIEPGSTVQFDADNASVTGFAAGAGSLSISGGLNMSDSGHYVWNLASLSETGAGTNFDQLSVAGGATFGGTSALDLDFSLLSGDQRPDSGTLNSFWNSSRTWKIIDLTSGTNNSVFSTINGPTITGGVFSLALGTGADAGDMLLKYVTSNVQIPGDANHSGTVDSTDFGILAAHFGQTTGQSYETGDFNGDGIVNALDFNVIATNYGKTSPADIADAAAAANVGQLVPEPTSIGLLGLGATMMLRRRKQGK